MGSMTVISKENYQSEVEQSEVLVLLDFTAAWCGPCKLLTPVLEQLAEEFAGKVKIVKVDVDQNRELAVQFKVASVPTVVYYKSGKVLKRFVNNKSKSAIKAEITELLNS